MSREEERAWETAAAAYDQGKGVPLEEVDPDDKDDMKQVYDALKVTDYFAQKRLTKYIRGLRASRKWQQPQFFEKVKAGLELMAEDYLMKKRTIVLSEATGSAKNDLMDMLGLPEKGCSWLKRPALLKRVNGFSWLDSDEDSEENRTAYIAYLKRILHIPEHYALADAQPNRALLTVELLREIQDSRRISGTTDVAIAKSEHVRNEAIRNNIETLLELKKPKNLRKKDHAPQMVGEHFAASYLNPKSPVVSVLTDLNKSWTFRWFAREDDNSDVALYKLYLDGDEAAAEAKYLLDSLFDDSYGDKVPNTFFNRISFQAVLDSVVQTKKKRVRMELDVAGSGLPDHDSNSPSFRADQHSTPTSSGTDADAASRGGGTTHRDSQDADGGGGGQVSMASTLSLFAPQYDRDVANELDLIDMVDKSQQYEIVRSFAEKHIVPHMMS